MSNIRIAQVAGGAGGGGALVDTVTSVSIQDTRIRMYSYAVTAACEIRLDDSTGSVIKQSVVGTNTQDSVYLPDQGIKISGVVSVVGISNGGKFFVYYG
tara:strand:- start:115 stop:411 length:297 start_codon:yes stop_codon:yes gene_type:complete